MSGCWDASGGLAEAQRDVKTLLVVAVALLDKYGRILLSKRPEGKKLAGLWEFPGGKVDPGETPERSLIRELQEELASTRGQAAWPQSALPVTPMKTFTC